MKLETAYYTSQMVVAVAVVLSLVALTLQVRQSTETLQHESLSVAAARSAQNLMKFTEPAFARVWAKSFTKSNSLQLAEIVQIDGWMTTFFVGREAEFLQYQQGLMDEATWQTRIVGITSNLSGRWHRHW